MTFGEWKEKIELQRFEDYKMQLKEQAKHRAEYYAYISQYKNYSYEDMRDYGHTWGEGFEEEPEPKLPYQYEVEGQQAIILQQMIEKGMSDEDIYYIFLDKCSWDDEYEICQLGKEYEFTDVLLALIDHWKSEAKWYEYKIEAGELSWEEFDFI